MHGNFDSEAIEVKRVRVHDIQRKEVPLEVWSLLKVSVYR